MPIPQNDTITTKQSSRVLSARRNSECPSHSTRPAVEIVVSNSSVWQIRESEYPTRNNMGTLAIYSPKKVCSTLHKNVFPNVEVAMHMCKMCAVHMFDKELYLQNLANLTMMEAIEKD